MFAGKSIFSQIVEAIHPQQFRRCVERYGGDYKVRQFSCWDQFLCLAFAQLTFRESLRDIEDCLAARPDQLYHLGFRSRICHRMCAPGRPPTKQRTRLAHLCRSRRAPHRQSPAALCTGGTRRGSPRYGLCAGLDDDRPLSEPFSLGRFSPRQSRRQTAHLCSIWSRA